MSSITVDKARTTHETSLWRGFLEFTGIGRYLRRKRTEHDLMRMSDRQLRDIGLNRYEIKFLIREIH